MTSGALLVVAGEASGDAMAARVVESLPVRAFGVGGMELSTAGAELVADIRSFSAMGISGALARAPRLARVIPALFAAIRAQRPRAALLVGFSEVNARLSPWLRRSGVRVLWYAPPQVWAWRAGRASRIARTVDRLAVILPFENTVWRHAGADVQYVGHPALDRARSAGTERRPQAGRLSIALLPGSRDHEVRAHLEPMVDALDGLFHPNSSARAEGRIVLARSVSDGTAEWVRRLAGARGVSVSEDPIENAVRDADVAVASSGTATLECAALGVPPVIVYKTDRLTHAVAKRCLRVSWIGLPNLLLGRNAFPELVQHDVVPSRIREAVRRVASDPEHYRALCDTTRAMLEAGLGEETAGTLVARMIEPWLS